MKKIIALLLALTFPVSVSASIEDVQKYIEINGLTLYGEYVDIKDYKKTV